MTGFELVSGVLNGLLCLLTMYRPTSNSALLHYCWDSYSIVLSKASVSLLYFPCLAEILCLVLGILFRLPYLFHIVCITLWRLLSRRNLWNYLLNSAYFIFHASLYLYFFICCNKHVCLASLCYLICYPHHLLSSSFCAFHVLSVHDNTWAT